MDDEMDEELCIEDVPMHKPEKHSDVGENGIQFHVTLGFNERIQLIQQFLVLQLGLLMWMPTDTYILPATLCMQKKPRAFREKASQDQEGYGGLCLRACVVLGCLICI